MSRFAVIGDPVAHSASPRLFDWLAGRLGLELGYEAVRVPAGALASVLEEARAGRWDGLSVTIPHKQDALVLAERADPRATRAGAANCLVRAPDGRLVAHNLVRLTPVVGLAGELVAGHHRPGVQVGAGKQDVGYPHPEVCQCRVDVHACHGSEGSPAVLTGLDGSSADHSARYSRNR